MKYKKLLISGLGGSLFPYLHHKLVDAGYTIYYVDNNERLSDIYPELNFIYAPKVSDHTYRGFIDELIIKFDIDVYVPLIDEELLAAKERESGSYAKEIVVITPSLLFTQLCLKKDKLMDRLSSLGLSAIGIYLRCMFQ